MSHRTLPAVMREWRRPSFETFAPRTAWSLLSAFTTALGPRSASNPQEHARVTIRIGALVDAAADIRTFRLREQADDATGADTAA